MHLDFHRLVEHFRRTRRDLPWRRFSDAYRILVSEVMLQQTRVETVIGYYERFLEKFPSWEALAEADEHSLMAAWAGLGYYRRARNLQKCAQAVVARGGFPSFRAEMREFPGVGDYTAAALESIVNGRPALALDGNAVRVLWRYLGLKEDRPAVRRQVAAQVEPLIPADAAREFTEAVMELGATLCKPTSPSCLVCPLREGCQGKGSPEEFPAPRGPQRTVDVLRAAVLAFHEDRLWLRQASPGELMEGLWQFPTVDIAREEEAEAALTEALGQPAKLERIGQIRHAITFRRIRCVVYQCELRPAGVREGSRTAWVPTADLATWPLPSPARKMLRLLNERGQNRTPA